MNSTAWLLGVLAIFSIETASAQTPTVDCDFKTVAKFCEAMKAKEETQLRSKSPYKFSNGESMPSIDSITGDTIPTYDSGAPNIPWGQMQRLQKLYGETQKYAQDAILQGRRLDDLSVEEKNLITRIKTMKLSNLTSSDDLQVCKDNYRFGFSPRTNTLVMCPEMAGYPSSGIVWAMGAFMGRGLGSCATAGFKYLDNKKQVVFDTIPAEKHPFNLSCDSNDCEAKDDSKSLRGCLMQGGYPDNASSVDPAKPEFKKIIDAEIARSYQMKAPDMPVRSETVSDAIKNEKNIEWMKTRVTGLRECLPEQTGAKVDSGIQDWFGSEVAGRYLADHPLNAQTAEDNLQPISTMIDFKCRTAKADELERKFHAPLETRFMAGIFGNERLRKAMNCSPKTPAKKTCSVNLPPGTAPANPAGTKATQSRETSR